jgi:hypothetical protein
MITSRRSFITGLAALITAPAIVRAGSLMPVKVMEPVWRVAGYSEGALGCYGLKLGDLVEFCGNTYRVISKQTYSGVPYRDWANLERVGAESLKSFPLPKRGRDR